MTNDCFIDVFPDKKKVNKKNHQRLFFIEGLSTIESKLIENKQNSRIHTTRCEQCGFPIHIKPVLYKREDGDSKSHNEIEENIDTRNCSICTRTKFLNAVLISSYILSAVIFALLIIGTIFDFVSLDFSLIIGCLEIIFLLFFGRYLEEAVFFGFSQEEKLLAALYRFSESGEIQALDIAMKYIKKYKIEAISDEFFQGVLHVLTYQPLSVPYYFQDELTRHLKLTVTDFEDKLSSIIDEDNEIPYLKSMIQKVPPSGIGVFADISIKTENQLALNEIFKRIEKEISSEPIDSEFIKELYINKTVYAEAYTTYGDAETLAKIDLLIANFKAPKVPSVDVVAGSRKIMQHPFMRYIIRIFLYIVLAFLLGFLYQLLN